MKDWLPRQNPAPFSSSSSSSSSFSFPQKGRSFDGRHIRRWNVSSSISTRASIQMFQVQVGARRRETGPSHWFFSFAQLGLLLLAALFICFSCYFFLPSFLPSLLIRTGSLITFLLLLIRTIPTKLLEEVRWGGGFFDLILNCYHRKRFLMEDRVGFFMVSLTSFFFDSFITFNIDTMVDSSVDYDFKPKYKTRTLLIMWKNIIWLL